jgi:uncharacterized membrane protein
MKSDVNGQFNSPLYQIYNRELFNCEIITSRSSSLGVFMLWISRNGT